VNDFKSGMILLKLGEKQVGARKAREVAEAERIWKLDNKNKDKVEKQKVIESTRTQFINNIKTIALSLKVKEDSFQVSTLIF
jgi:hypothetical protein